MHARFYDGRRVARVLALRTQTCCLRYTDSVGTQNEFSIAAQMEGPHVPLPTLADTLTDACARLGPMWFRYPSS